MRSPAHDVSALRARPRSARRAQVRPSRVGRRDLARPAHGLRAAARLSQDRAGRVLPRRAERPVHARPRAAASPLLQRLLAGVLPLLPEGRRLPALDGVPGLLRRPPLQRQRRRRRPPSGTGVVRAHVARRRAGADEAAAAVDAAHAAQRRPRQTTTELPYVRAAVGGRRRRRQRPRVDRPRQRQRPRPRHARRRRRLVLPGRRLRQGAARAPGRLAVPAPAPLQPRPRRHPRCLLRETLRPSHARRPAAPGPRGSTRRRPLVPPLSAHPLLAAAEDDYYDFLGRRRDLTGVLRSRR
mmetsp:Transcript_22789/g.70017  ORF Transcript_22789/g.70017 Transcript_22789/m.70017 type:complete len:297 (+) Transcript_22789:978-1868(+)